jgi:hypothetical protein
MSDAACVAAQFSRGAIPMLPSSSDQLPEQRELDAAGTARFSWQLQHDAEAPGTASIRFCCVSARVGGETEAAGVTVTVAAGAAP